MTVHSVSCIVALSKAAVIGHPTGYRHTCIQTHLYTLRRRKGFENKRCEVWQKF